MFSFSLFFPDNGRFQYKGQSIPNPFDECDCVAWYKIIKI